MTIAIVFTIGVYVLAATGDAILGGVITGIFTLLNTLIGAHLLRTQSRTRTELTDTRTELRAELADTRRVLEQPRRIVYDREGQPVGFLVCSSPDMDVVREAGRPRRELAQDDPDHGGRW